MTLLRHSVFVIMNFPSLVLTTIAHIKFIVWIRYRNTQIKLNKKLLVNLEHSLRSMIFDIVIRLKLRRFCFVFVKYRIQTNVILNEPF